MRQLPAWVLLGTAACSLKLAFASGLPRGVNPTYAKFYEPSASFSCITRPEIKLSSSQLNDNSCDCPDGSDEPGTAACAHLNSLSPPQPLPGSSTGTTNTSHALPGFWCANAGHIGSYVPFMYVNDGVCDYDLCCDGSEEYGGVGGVKCDNKCAEIGKEWRRVEEERKKSVARSAKKRASLLREALYMKLQVNDRILRLTEEIQSIETKRDELKKRYEELEREERGKVVKPEGEGKLGVLLGMAKSRVLELRNTLDRVLDQRDDLKDRVVELEEILKKFKQDYNPNFNDEGVKQAVKAWEDYAAKYEGEAQEDAMDIGITEVLKEDGENSGINWKEFEEDEATDTDILYNLEAYLPPQIRTYIRDRLTDLRTWLMVNGILADNSKPGTESKRVAAAREAYEASANDLSAKQNSLDEHQKDLEKDYGADHIFRALKGKCVSTESGEYEYELCWMDKTTQKSRRGGGDTNMGNFVRIDREMVDEQLPADGKGLGSGERMVLRFENGQHCWNGPARSTHVWLACAETEELWKVSESEKCVYRMEVGTPAACDPPKEEQEHVRDEL